MPKFQRVVVNIFLFHSHSVKPHFVITSLLSGKKHSNVYIFRPILLQHTVFLWSPATNFPCLTQQYAESTIPYSAAEYYLKTTRLFWELKPEYDFQDNQPYRSRVTAIFKKSAYCNKILKSGRFLVLPISCQIRARAGQLSNTKVLNKKASNDKCPIKRCSITSVQYWGAQ